MRRFSRLLVGALLALPLLVTVGGEVLAGSTLNGTIRGRVTDEKGEPLVGVTVQLRSPALIREQVRLTDADGSFVAADLPRGAYTVVAQLTGYITTSYETDVESDRVTPLAMVLKEGELSETVTVTATRPVVDKTSTEKSESYDKTFTDNLPAGRSYQSLIQFAPGVVGGSNANVLGGTSSSNQYLIDGVSTRDPVTGTFGSNINFDAIETVEIKLTGISAEYGEFQGGLTNVLTKSGGNEFSGSFRDVVSAAQWTNLYKGKADKALAPEVFASAAFVGNCNTAGLPPGTFNYRTGCPGERPGLPSGYPTGSNAKTNRISLTLGGPVVVDTAWFFMSYDRVDTRAAAVLGNPVGGTSGNGTYTNFFDGDIPSVKLTWQATNNHRVQYSYFEDPARTTRCYGQIFFGGPCFDSYTVDLQGQGGFSYIANWNATWTPVFTTDFKYTRFQNSFDIQPLTPIPFKPQFIFPGNRGFQLANGNGSSIELATGSAYDANIFDDTPEKRRREQWELQTTTFIDTEGVGSHTVKIGADYKEQDRVGASIISGNALLYFYRNPNQPNPDAVDGRAYYYWYDFAEPTSAKPVNKFTALYVNDDWQLNENLSFNLGLRWEKSDNQNDVGDAIINDSGFAPRLGVAWDVTGQGKHVVKATASRYLAGINLTTISPFVRLAGGQSAFDFYINGNFNPADIPGTAALPVDPVLLFSQDPDPTTSQFEPGIVPQNIDEFTVGYEFQFNPTFGVGVKYVDRKWNDIITFVNRFDYTAGTRQIQTLRVNPDADRSYKGVVLTGDKRFANNWEFRGSYVWSETKGNVESENGFDTYGQFAGVPQTTENREGLLSFDFKHALKFQAFYEVPVKSARHGVTLGGIFDFRSGNPFARNRTISTVVGPGPDGVQDNPLGTQTGAVASDDQFANVLTYFEPRGSGGREPNVWTLDLSTKYRFSFSKNTSFEATFEVFNVTDEQKPLTVSTNWFENPTSSTQLRTNYLYGFPTAYSTGSTFQTPRAYRLNFAILW